jgi:hypothetical protein
MCLTISVVIGFAVLKAETKQITAFWNVTPCSMVDIYQCFRGTCWLHLQGRTIINAGRKQSWCKEGRTRAGAKSKTMGVMCTPFQSHRFIFHCSHWFMSSLQYITDHLSPALFTLYIENGGSRFFWNAVPFLQATWHHILEDHNLESVSIFCGPYYIKLVPHAKPT